MRKDTKVSQQNKKFGSSRSQQNTTYKNVKTDKIPIDQENQVENHLAIHERSEKKCANVKNV